MATLAVDDDPATRESVFTEEVARLRRAGVVAAGGRLRDLFDFLADRGLEADAATQSDISAAVFGQAEPDADDATVRVYVHRLRKRLDDHYAAAGTPLGVKLEIPAGAYALRLIEGVVPMIVTEASGSLAQPAAIGSASNRLAANWRRAWPLAAILALVAAFAGGWALSPTSPPPVNPIWEPLLASKRPVLIVLGDYYIYGEIDPLHPEDGQLIRDFQVNSATDLKSMQELFPERYAGAEDMGLNYLPFSAAYGLQAVEPLLKDHGKQVSIIAASQLEADMLNHYDVVYVGLLSGMRLLEDLNFMGSGFTIGDSYDELIDVATGRSYISEEALSLASQAYYRDYAYIARYRAPSGALVIAIAGARDTGLRGLSPIAGGTQLPPDLAKAARDDPQFEALFEVTGQQGADLSERLIVARARSEDQM